MLSLLALTSAIITIVYGFPCCVIHQDEAACAAEAGTACVFLQDTDPIYTSGKSLGAQCVSDKWLKCEKDSICPPPPPIPPTVSSECVLSECTSHDIEYNVAFVIDESGSVGKTNYLISLDFIENMVAHDLQDNAKISMIAFSSGTDRIYNFGNSGNERQGALAALQKERSDYDSGSTCMGKAIDLAVNDFKSATFITPNDLNILFFMTDGHPSNCVGNVCDRKAALDAYNIEVYIIGVGSGFSPTKVSCLIDADKQKRIMAVNKFDDKDFYKIESYLRSIVCPVVFEKDTMTESVGYVSGVVNGFTATNGELSLLCMVIGAILIRLMCFWKGRVCNKDDKYIALADNENTADYGSAQVV